ncbi:FAD-dependent oxidoreductase [Nocardioides jejuensis]|uniref:ferredoxin--NADP(+) reductase n=1 Tax=Nocardioides jejuensis TaxID=2502782 RepID=A0A4R1CE94_9ACTN|nr:FAD-dependent oxidoreductase [Nocardioides jejuensis]TCJ28917.1 4Fe-4S dicluster domain-containing protein [Nocardioides jejuensis]
MPHVVTQSCCADASCVVACPVNAIHPGPLDDTFALAEQVYIDPKTCVDCGACVTACPVGAIKAHTRLEPAELPFVDINADFFAEVDRTGRPVLAPLRRREKPAADSLRVAVVGAGPAGLYVADELLHFPGVTVTVLDRLDVPHGLARFGVAPDHGHTRKIRSLFETIEKQPGFTYELGVEVGKDVTHEQLRAAYDAVIYTVGASADRSMGIPGEELAGSVSATSIVGWYNGHPDHVGAAPDLTGERVVVVGNGNVALDVARILTADPSSLEGTEIAPAALEALRGSSVREVVVLGRRGPAEAAFTMPELVGLAGLADVDVLVHGGDAVFAGLPSSPKVDLLREIAARPASTGERRRIVLRFFTAPVAVVGATHATGLEVARTELVAGPDGVLRAELSEDHEVIEASMVLRSVGYRGRPVPGLPFDEKSGTVPNEQGRVEPGVYVAGWIKRGPTGFLGTNKTCAEQTVDSLLADVASARIAHGSDKMAAR